MKRILVIDDEQSVRYSFVRVFGKKYEVITAENGLEGLKKVRAVNPDVVIIDYKMPVMNGIESLKKIKQISPDLPIILMTAFGDTETAIEAMKCGAYDYIVKPFDNDELVFLIEKALSSTKVIEDSTLLSLRDDDREYQKIIGRSPAIINVCKIIGQVALTDMPILITGQSGVGKELVARAIHEHSQRKNRPFLGLNCASLPEGLIESELFGYESGAFTGAVKRRIGLFEQCMGGTLLLDEIGDMSLSAQAKLLRVLQESTFQRLGGNSVVVVDVRIIAATNKDLTEEVKKGNFREDLYHRLNVVSIHIPPLKERKEDIAILAEYFVKKAASEIGKNIRGISSEAITVLENHHWKGNVRELQNTLKRAVVTARGSIIDIEDLSLSVSETESDYDLQQVLMPIVDSFLVSCASKPFDHLISKVEKILIKRALELSGGNQVKASSMLGITRVTLRKKMEDYGLSAV